MQSVATLKDLKPLSLHRVPHSPVYRQICLKNRTPEKVICLLDGDEAGRKSRA